MPTRQLIPAAILIALASPAVHGQTTKAKKPAAEPAHQSAPGAQSAPASSLLTQLDADHDGKVSRAEWKGNPVSFQMLDRNGDGVLTAEELGAGAAPAAPAEETPAAAFARLDANHDGHVSRDEWQGGLGDFQALDRNSDGVLSREELLANNPARARQERLFRWMDANHDGRVTKAEWRGDPARFQTLDRNHDGVVTLDEMAKK